MSAYGMAISSLCPTDEWSLTGDDLSTLVWHSQTTPPTVEEIEAEVARLSAADS